VENFWLFTIKVMVWTPEGLKISPFLSNFEFCPFSGFFFSPTAIRREAVLASSCRQHQWQQPKKLVLSNSFPFGRHAPPNVMEKTLFTPQKFLSPHDHVTR
jgi:hypothetical protein